VPKNSASDKYVIDTTRLVAQFTTTLTDMAEPRCFSGKISDGITHPIGPKLILLSNQRESAKVARVRVLQRTPSFHAPVRAKEHHHTHDCKPAGLRHDRRN